MFELLTKTIHANTPGMPYLSALDWKVDQLIAHIDVERGLIVRGQLNEDQAYAAGDSVMPCALDGDLPHEIDPGYWELDVAEQAAKTPDWAKHVYTLNAGRDGTHPICEAAFCFSQPQSKHYGDEGLLQYINNAVRFHAGSIRADGIMGNFGLNGAIWAHGWDVEGLIYAIVQCGDRLDSANVAAAKESFARAADHMLHLPETNPLNIGSIGNQRSVWILSLYLYGKLLGRDDLLDMATRHHREIMPYVLDDSGQVIEQHGPCMHYSGTAFIYAWLNIALRGDDESARILNCLQWFRRRFTRSLYPLAGPSTRQYYELPNQCVMDWLPAAEQVAHLDPSLRQFIIAAAHKHLESLDAPDHPAHEDILRLAGSHAGSILMWCALFAQDGGATPPANDESVTVHYKSTRYHKRLPLMYTHVRRRYQTQYTFTDFLPFSGVQTWAWGDEPPIIHPTLLYPSTTTADGIDTARQGASHNWGLYGAGAMGVDGYVHAPDDDNDLHVLVARYHLLWRVVCFTECATVIVEFGPPSERRTCWTLNRNAPAEPRIAPHKVTFDSRVGSIHTTLAQTPQLLTQEADDPWARDVRQLVYTCDARAAAFALADDSFSFDPVWSDNRVVRFADACGSYELLLDERFFTNNPGHLRVDTFQLAYGSHVKAEWTR